MYSIIDGTLVIIDTWHLPTALSVETFGKSPLPVLADPAAIEQVLLNLLDNAVQSIQRAGRSHGSISIDTALPDLNFAEITVTDNGGGITEPDAQQLFAPFHTTTGRGLGLGFPLCRWIVEWHGGRLRHETCGDNGTMFKFTLPIRGDGRG